jgi:hypothetical protein
MHGVTFITFRDRPPSPLPETPRIHETCCAPWTLPLSNDRRAPKNYSDTKYYADLNLLIYFSIPLYGRAR